MPRKRSATRRRPEGSLREVDNGRWEARVTVRDLTKRSGKAERCKRFATRELAAAWLREMHGRGKGGELLPRAREGVTLEQWLREVYVTAPTSRLAPQVRAADWAIASRYVLRAAPALGARRLAELTAHDLTEHFHHLARRSEAAGRPLSRATLKRVHALLAARLTDAVLARERTGLAASPLPSFKHLGLRVAPDRVMRRLAAAELAAILAEAPHVPHGAVIAFLALTGTRPGEALGLTWDRVDLEGGRVEITHALVRRRSRAEGATKWTLAPTKTRTRRSLELAPALVALLRAHHAAQREAAALLGADYHHGPAGGFVFASDAEGTHGEPLHLHTLNRVTLSRIVGRAACRLTARPIPPLGAPSSSRAYRDQRDAHDATLAAARTAAGLDFVTCYTFRRSAASILAELGSDLLTVQTVLGHARTSTTDVYIKRLQDRAAPGSRKLAEHIATLTPPPAPAADPALRLVKQA